MQDELEQRHQELAEQETLAETRDLEQSATDSQRERELRRLQLRHEHDERQFALLREELERVARFLIDDAPSEARSRAA